TVEPITIPEPLPIQEPEPVILAQEPDSVITPAVPSGPSAAQIEEALQDNSANETYDELSRDDAFLAKKHADMAARYAELASEYQSLAREHADLSQRHSDVAAEKKRLEDEKNDLLARKRELISQIHQTGKSLADIISDTGASSAIILKNGDLVAQFSQMERDSLQEIASTVIRHWDNKTKRDLVRFIRLSTDNNEFSLYASLIREDFILGLIYDPATPISLMRSQSAEITDKLAGEPLIDYIKLPVEDLEKISEEESLPVDVDEEITGLFSESGEDDFINEWVPESGDLNSAANKSSSTPTPDWIAENITNQGSDTLSPLLMDVINQLQKQRDAVQTDSSDIQDDLGVEQTPVAPSPTAWMENADAQSILHDVMSQLQEQEADSQHETPDIIDLEDYEKTFEIKAEPTTDEKVVEESSETILQSVLQQLQQQEEAVIQAEAEDAYELGTLEINDLPMPPVEEEKMADQSPENYPVIELPAPEPILDETVIEESASEPSAFEEPDQEVILLDAYLTTHDENSAEDQGKAGEVENSTSSDLPIQTGETEILPAQDETPETTPASNPIEIYSEEVLQDVLSQLEKQEKSVEHQDFPSFDEGDEALADIDEMIEEIIPNFEPQNSATVQEKITESTSADDNDLDQKKDIFHEVLNQLQQADETAEAISLDGNGSSEENVEEVDEPLIFPWEEVDSEQPVVERTSPLLLTPTEEDALSRTQPIKVKAEISPAGSEKLVKNIEEHKTAINNLLSQQTYTCLLIPRRTDTPLSAELSQILSEQLTQIASVFGWNLEKIEIHTDYLLWSIQVLPAVSATNMIRLIRQRTSRRLFTLYPQMLENNTSGDFWAPGFLTVSGSTPPEKIAVENFINQTRRRQQLINTLEA
ncbi:MAG: transposase, partial [Anaerolineae bacterium]|nr:transposase [Anaerolineae bacterium]